MRNSRIIILPLIYSLFVLLCAGSLVFTPPTHVTVINSKGILRIFIDGKLINSASNKPNNISTVEFTMEKTRENAFLHFLQPEEKSFLTDLKSQKSVPLVESKSNTPFKTLIGGTRVLFTGLIYYSDAGGNVRVSSEKKIEDFKLEAFTYDLSLFQLIHGKNQIFIRPTWHHENLIAIDGTLYAGDASGLSISSLIKRLLRLALLTVLCSILIFIITLLSGFFFEIVRKGWLWTKRILFYPKDTIKSRGEQKLLQVQHIKQIGITLLLLLLFGVFIYFSLYTISNITEKIPHSQDEVAYIFQSKILAQGRLYWNSLPGDLKHFVDHEFILNNGKWFGMYTLGWPLILAVAQFIKVPYIANLVVSLFTLILLLKILNRELGWEIALIAGFLYVTSPLTILHASNYLSHTTAQLCLLVAIFGLLRRKPALIGLGTGYLFLTRPYEGSIYLLIIVAVSVLQLFGEVRKEPPLLVCKKVISWTTPIVLFFFIFFVIQICHNYLLSGQPLTLPISLYSPFTQIGFGPRGVEWPQTFTVVHALENTLFNLLSLADMLTPLPIMIGVFLIPFAMVVKNRVQRKIGSLMVLVFVANVGMYFPYYANGTFYGPRFWIVSLFSLFVLLALSFKGLERILSMFFHRSVARIVIYCYLMIGLSCFIITLPGMLKQFIGYNGMHPFSIKESIQKPAAVFVNGKYGWQSYGRYFQGVSPSLDDDDVIFLLDNGQGNIRNEVIYDNSIAEDYFKNRHFYMLEDVLK